MSERYGAFMRTRVARPTVVRWLEAPPADPARWTDWRAIGGSWYFLERISTLAEASEAEVADTLASAQALIAPFPTARAALRGLIQPGEATAARHITYDTATGEFVAGTLFYEEGLVPFLAFLALARGLADVLGPDDTGVVVIHDYVFAPDEEEATAAALALGPGNTSRVLAEAESAPAVEVFRAVVDAMLADPGTLPPAIDQLDELR